MAVGIVVAIISAVVGKYLGGGTGLGHLAVVSLNDFKASMRFAVIILLTLIGFVLYAMIGLLRRVLMPQHESVVRIA